MSHTSTLPSGNLVTHNGAWDGGLEFEKEPTVVDCLDVLSLVAQRLENARLWGDLEIELKELRFRLIEERGQE